MNKTIQEREKLELKKLIALNDTRLPAKKDEKNISWMAETVIIIEYYADERVLLPL
jgi:hypothetical protein